MASLRVLTTLTIALIAVGAVMAAPPRAQPPPLVDPPALAAATDVDEATLEAAPAPPPRTAHIRIWGADAELLYSTWGGEAGLYADEDPVEWTGDPIVWHHSSVAREGLPLWGPLLEMLDHAPPNATLRLVDHDLGDLRVGSVELPAAIELHARAALPRELATEAFGDLTAGTNRLLWGEIPVKIVGERDNGIEYQITAEEGDRFDVRRAPGLALEASVVTEDLLRLDVAIPDGAFTAHKNCDIGDARIPPGYYVVRTSSADAYELDRYNTRGEFLLTGRTVTLEIRFMDA